MEGQYSEEVEAVARGRVWSGVRAREVGLVDELGGLHDAIDEARRLAGLKEGARVELVNPVRLEALPALGSGVLGLLRSRTTAPLAPALSNAYNPLLVWALEGESTPWAMAPWSLEVP